MTTVHSLLERRFTASEVAFIAQVNIETLKSWRRRVKFNLEASTTGWTRYTFVDVVKIATFQTLLNSFQSHELAEIVTSNSGEQYAKILRGGDGNGGGESLFLVCGRSPSGEVLFEIAVGVEGLLAEISKRTAQGFEYPAYHVVDYVSILFNVIERIKALDAE